MELLLKRTLCAWIGVLLLSAASFNANAFSYAVSIDTTQLQGITGAIAFDLIDGDGLVNNTVSIENFTSDATLATNFVTGDVSGDLGSGPLDIGDASFFNEWLQDVTFGSFINFRLTGSANGPFSPVPDSFSFFVLDSALVPYPTSDPLGADALFVIDIENADPAVQVFTSSTSTVSVSAVPVPAGLWLFVSGGAAMLGLSRRTRCG